MAPLTEQQVALKYNSARVENDRQNAQTPKCITDIDCTDGKNCEAGTCVEALNVIESNEVRKKTHDIEDIKGLGIVLNGVLLAPGIYTTEGNSCTSVCAKASLEKQEQPGQEKTLRVGETFTFKIRNTEHTINFATLQDANNAKVKYDNRLTLLNKDQLKVMGNVYIKVIDIKDVVTSATADTITVSVRDSTPLPPIDTKAYSCQKSYTITGEQVGCDISVGSRTCQCITLNANTKRIIAKSRSGR